MINSPHEVGDEAFTMWIPCREKTGWPVGEMIVVVELQKCILGPKAVVKDLAKFWSKIW